MSPIAKFRPLKYRSIWISDVHLGYKGCKAEFLLDFLRSTETEYLFLVGDIIDVWSMQKTMHWPQAHNNIIRAILGKAKQGAKVIYIPGNHDDIFRAHAGMVLGNLEIHEEYEHTTLGGKKVLMLHGDKYDTLMKSGMKFGWITEFVGSLGYDFLLFVNRWLDKLRRFLGFSYWSFAKYLKSKVRNAMRHVEQFERVVAKDAQRQGYDMVVCGHIHHAEIRQIDNILYCNDGDWIEHCTALVEKTNGEIELIHWSDKQLALKQIGQTRARELQVA